MKRSVHLVIPAFAGMTRCTEFERQMSLCLWSKGIVSMPVTNQLSQNANIPLFSNSIGQKDRLSGWKSWDDPVPGHFSRQNGPLEKL